MKFDIIIQFIFENFENFIDKFLFQIIKSEFDWKKSVE